MKRKILSRAQRWWIDDEINLCVLRNIVTQAPTNTIATVLLAWTDLRSHCSLKKKRLLDPLGNTIMWYIYTISHCQYHRGVEDFAPACDTRGYFVPQRCYLIRSALIFERISRDITGISTLIIETQVRELLTYYSYEKSYKQESKWTSSLLAP